MNVSLTNFGVQLQILLPIFSAKFLGAFFFNESLLYYQTNCRTSRWFVYFYLLLTFLYLLGSVAGLILPDQAAMLSSLLLIPSGIGLILLVVFR